MQRGEKSVEAEGTAGAKAHIGGSFMWWRNRGRPTYPAHREQVRASRILKGRVSVRM